MQERRCIYVRRISYFRRRYARIPYTRLKFGRIRSTRALPYNVSPMYDTVDFSTSFNVRMMLNKETGETWNDFYTNENSYKIYDDPDIIEIPVTDIIAGASDHILNNAEIAEAIEGWILKKIK